MMNQKYYLRHSL